MRTGQAVLLRTCGCCRRVCDVIRPCHARCSVVLVALLQLTTASLMEFGASGCRVWNEACSTGP